MDFFIFIFIELLIAYVFIIYFCVRYYNKKYYIWDLKIKLKNWLIIYDLFVSKILTKKYINLKKLIKLLKIKKYNVLIFNNLVL